MGTLGPPSEVVKKKKNGVVDVVFFIEAVYGTSFGEECTVFSREVGVLKISRYLRCGGRCGRLVCTRSRT